MSEYEEARRKELDVYENSQPISICAIYIIILRNWNESNVDLYLRTT